MENDTNRAIIEHVKSGEVFAVEHRAGIVRMCGPLHYTDVHAPLGDYHYDDEEPDFDWSQWRVLRREGWTP